MRKTLENILSLIDEVFADVADDDAYCDRLDELIDDNCHSEARALGAKRKLYEKYAADILDAKQLYESVVRVDDISQRMGVEFPLENFIEDSRETFKPKR